MNPPHIRTRLDAELLDRPEIADWVGKTVDITLAERPPDSTPDLRALDALAGQNVIDPAAVSDLRRISTT